MSGGKALLDQIIITLKDNRTSNLLPVYINVHDNSLSRKWLAALNELVKNNYHLEKNYCFVGFTEHARNAEYICAQINKSIAAINDANLGYTINDCFTVENTVIPGPYEARDGGSGDIDHNKLNHLHRYFEDLQGVSGQLSSFYTRADAVTRWHIRQLNLLCHEYESLLLSLRKDALLPEWKRPSQLMCWLNAPRFNLEPSDYELFGIESINRTLGGVFVGVNKAVGKHHWEVFVDEAGYNPAHVANNLVTSTLRPQLEAAGDFDIEWANDPGDYNWQKVHLQNFRLWLINNGFDPEDKALTIGHPQVGQVDLQRTFNSTDYQQIWKLLGSHLNVYKIETTDASVTYNYNWDDAEFMDLQVDVISRGYQ